MGLTVVLGVSVCGCSNQTETVKETAGEILEETTKETSEVTEIAEKAVSRSVGGNVEKEETVYVNADAGGKVKEITVSSWLKNGSGAAKLTDVTKLMDVINVKGDETFTQDGDTYIWAADGNDIYYQGVTSKALPVDVKVTYYLDDENIDPGELAGKSGRIKIRFDYENHSRQQTTIGGKEAEICVPFVAASTLILDSDRFVNVEVENGKILSDGKNTIVAGVAMPGLYDSLDLLNLEGFEDIDIPEYVEVTADVTDFELDMTATVLMPDVFGELNTDDMSGFDDLKDDIEELNDATYELIDGCIELDDGVQEMKDNMPDLWDGAVELDDGAAELNDGAWELDDGAQDLKDGAEKLNDGAKDIRQGAKELDQGTGTLQTGIRLLNGQMPKLTGGANMLADGLQSIQDPMMLGPDGQSGDAEHPYIKTSVGHLKNGVDRLATGVSTMGSSLEQALADNQKEMQESQKEVILLTDELKKAVGEAETLQGQLTELAVQAGMLSLESSAEQKKTAEGPVTSEQTTEDNPGGSDAVWEGENESAAEGNENVPGTASGNENGSDVAKGDESISGAAPESRDESSAEGNENESTAEGNENIPGTASGNENESAAAKGDENTSETASGNENESTAEENENVSGAASESRDESTAVEENGSSADAETETVSASEGTVEEQEMSEFARSYLESLGEADGMTSMGMVLMADAGQGTGVSDPAAVIEKYKKVVALQTELIWKLNEITELQNQLREAATDYAGLVGADTALKQVAGQLNSSADAEQLMQLTEGMAALESSIGQIYDGIALINSQMGTLTGGAEELQQGVGDLKVGADALKNGTEKLYQGGVDLREGTKELYEGTEELKDGTEELKDGTGELKDGTQELRDGVVDLVDGVDELKDGTKELLDGVHEYNDDGIRKLYDAVNVDLQNLRDRVDAISELSAAYQSFSGKSDEIEGSVKFIIETEAIELEESD